LYFLFLQHLAIFTGKLFSFVPVYSLVFPGYTIKRVGFGKSPYGPYPIETSLDLPHPCRSRKGGALFVVVILNEWRLLILSFFAWKPPHRSVVNERVTLWWLWRGLLSSFWLCAFGRTCCYLE